MIRHAIVVVLVAAFLALGWWQVTRAVGGNVLSYAYAVEWPVFAGFVIFVWVKEMRRAVEDETAEPPTVEVPRMPTPRSTPARTGAAYDDSNDPELASYNRYLAWLAANPDNPP